MYFVSQVQGAVNSVRIRLMKTKLSLLAICIAGLSSSAFAAPDPVQLQQAIAKQELALKQLKQDLAELAAQQNAQGAEQKNTLKRLPLPNKKPAVVNSANSVLNHTAALTTLVMNIIKMHKIRIQSAVLVSILSVSLPNLVISLMMHGIWKSKLSMNTVVQVAH